jgi:hypothetical protein
MGDKLSQENKKNIESHINKKLVDLSRGISNELKEHLFANRFKHHLATILFSVIGIIMAFAWKDFITEAVKSVIKNYIPEGNLILSTLVTATLISIVCLFLVIIILNWTKKDN